MFKNGGWNRREWAWPIHRRLNGLPWNTAANWDRVPRLFEWVDDPQSEFRGGREMPDVVRGHGVVLGEAGGGEERVFAGHRAVDELQLAEQGFPPNQHFQIERDKTFGELPLGGFQPARELGKR